MPFVRLCFVVGRGNVVHELQLLGQELDIHLLGFQAKQGVEAVNGLFL